MSSNIQDKIEAIEKRQKIYRKADKIKGKSNPDAAKIAALYEKYSLENVEIGLKNRREIRAGVLDKPTVPANKPLTPTPSAGFSIGTFGGYVNQLFNKVLGRAGWLKR